jgi:hypothetical protein
LELHLPVYYMGVRPGGPRLAFFARQAGSSEPGKVDPNDEA